MKTFKTATPDAIVKLNHPVASLRDTLLNEALLWLCMVSLPSVAISLARMQATGWLPLFGYQLFLLSLLWFCWFGRRHIAYLWRVGVVLFVLGTAGLGGYVQYGPFAHAGRFLLLFWSSRRSSYRAGPRSGTPY